MQSDSRTQGLSICATVQAALREERLLFAFQPVVCAATGEVDYFECLLRMRDLEGGIVAGGEFIIPIEQIGLIGFIDGYVLEQTVRELADHPEIRLGINVSGLTACDGWWLDSLILLVRGRPDLARRLIVEITETRSTPRYRRVGALRGHAASRGLPRRSRRFRCRPYLAAAS